MRDLIIIGNGPAGMTALNYTARKHIDTLFLSKDRVKQSIWITGIEKYRSFK